MSERIFEEEVVQYKLGLFLRNNIIQVKETLQQKQVNKYGAYDKII